MRGKSLATRLPSKSIEEISAKLKGLRPYIPSDLSEIDRWKGTELAAMHLLLSPGTSAEMIDCVQGMLTSFVTHFGQLYGRCEITYNVHQLTHLASEYKQFGPLDNISAFPYENYLAQQKRLLRKPHLPLQQVVKRLSESPAETCTTEKDQKYLYQHYKGPMVSWLSHGEQFH